MKKRTILYCIIIFAIAIASISCKPVKTYYYEPKQTDLEGTVVIKTFYGPPGYGETPEVDSKETVPILKLEKPIAIYPSDTADKISVFENNIEEIQLVSKQYLDELLASENQKIKTHGMLFHSISGHHHTRVLMLLEKYEKE